MQTLRHHIARSGLLCHLLFFHWTVAQSRHICSTTTSQVNSCSARRWPASPIILDLVVSVNNHMCELINRELKSALGVGEHQGRGEEERIEKSFGIAVLAYL